MDDEILKRLRARAHAHSELCWGAPQPTCDKHHPHEDSCFSRPLRCRLNEDPDLLALLKWHDNVLHGIEPPSGRGDLLRRSQEDAAARSALLRQGKLIVSPSSAETAKRYEQAQREARRPALSYVRLPDGKATVTCSCGWKDPIGPVWPSPFDPTEALVAAQAAHPQCQKEAS